MIVVLLHVKTCIDLLIFELYKARSVAREPRETFVIKNECYEYKKYFLNHYQVDWIEYKVNRPVDIINLEEL